MPRNNNANMENENNWPNENSSAMSDDRPRHHHGRKLAFWIVLVVLILAVIWGMDHYGWLPGSNKFQAVFLNNGQVYFGHLASGYGDYLDLNDIYYLQVTQPQLQPGQANSATNINLVKLGSELHGPTDEMKINSQSVLFIETLRSDSRIVQAINQLEKK